MTYKKEQIISAIKKVYRLSLFFPKKEPLRYKVREVTNEILTDFILFSFENPGKKRKENLIENLEILDSYFEIIKDQNWVSLKDTLEIQSFFNDLKKEILEGKREETTANLAVNERQQKIVDYLKEREKVQVWEIKEIFPNVSKRTLRRDFQKLLKKGIIERVGEKSNTFYRLKNG